MISTRGPENIMVVDRTCVPLADVCTELITADNIGNISDKLPVTRDEIFECVDIFSEYFGPRDNDFIEVECTIDDKDINVEAAGLSDWVYITALQMGNVINKQENNLLLLFSMGMEKIMFDCLCDISQGIDDFMYSGIHAMVFESFEKSYGKIDQSQAEILLKTMFLEDHEQ